MRTSTSFGAILVAGLAILTAGCGSSIEPGTDEAGSGAGQAAQTGTEQAPATTADGALDFSAIGGTWTGAYEMHITGRGGGDTNPTKLQIETTAEPFSAVGTMWDGSPTTGEMVCSGKLIAVSASPPTYDLRARATEDTGSCNWDGALTLEHHPDDDRLVFRGRFDDLILEGEVTRESSS